MGVDCLVDALREDAAVFLEEALRLLVLLLRVEVPEPLPEVLFTLVLRVPDPLRLFSVVDVRLLLVFCVVFFCPEAAEVLVVFFF